MQQHVSSWSYAAYADRFTITDDKYLLIPHRHAWCSSMYLVEVMRRTQTDLLSRMTSIYLNFHFSFMIDAFYFILNYASQAPAALLTAQ